MRPMILLLLLGTPATAAEPALGVYRWANGTANVDAFAKWLDRPSVWGEDFIGGESWDNVQWPTWWLKEWGPWVHAKPGRRLVLAVPILAGPADRSGPVQGTKDLKVPVSLEKGAAGTYNHHFKQLAENLVAHKLGDVILRPGWEFNGGWYAWGAKDKAKLFAEYWRQIVKTMRAVPGTGKILFCWNPTLGDQDFPADEAWPGDEFVDIVGIDVYDETWNKDTYPWAKGATDDVILARQKKVWTEWIMGSPRGLVFWTKFAKDHKKLLAIPEWGLNRRKDGHGGGDNPHFIERMHAFVNDPTNNVLFHCYFDVNVPGDDHRHQLSPGDGEKGLKDGTEFPRAAARFQELFKAGK
ncbi:hypothetical protein KIH39_23205 [Telmatocola sphagniphila]|uniref:GH26 domain-containing protein n=1 Tax=Telmatocola sphagniphila TaxID=1123043 RepID=A0A8E6EUT9_9BACT|nr:glycosyl hydrolase [Telmatocola sphagniphila]QVL31717.1 hypothetical protein KIH39_23205 [Telmatocola sphagniphila]